MKRHALSWKTRSAVVLIALLGLLGTVSAQVYRWTDAKGVVHYSDKPHSRSEKPVELPKLQTVDPADLNAALATAQPAEHAENASTPETPHIIQPADGATIRTPGGHLPVAVAATLDAGQGLIYYLDGKAQNTKPTPALSMMLAGVWRGTHHIHVAVVDAQGQAVSASAPITIYMKQPSVHHPHP